MKNNHLLSTLIKKQQREEEKHSRKEETMKRRRRIGRRGLTSPSLSLLTERGWGYEELPLFDIEGDDGGERRR